MAGVSFTVELQSVRQGYDRKTCWVQTRAGVLPPHGAVITTQKLLLSGSDVFYGINSLRSHDGGRSFTPPEPQGGLSRQALPGAPGRAICPCDGTPAYHTESGRLLLTGHTAVYQGDRLAPSYRRELWYSVFDATHGRWSALRIVPLPETGHLYSAGAGCSQRLDLPGGDVLIPVYGHSREQLGSQDKIAHATIVRCRFDGDTLSYIDHGPSMSCPEPRGFGEPSLTAFQGRYYLTLRNDVTGFVCCGDDGMSFGAPLPWRFDDGQSLGNYNTQQHWVPHSDALFLVYTRRGAANDHVFRHRAPLFIAQVDPVRLCVLRETERIVIPEHGARLGNFGVTTVNAAESWVVASEWMQTTSPNPCDSTRCEAYGSDNRIWIGRIRWRHPNRGVPWDPVAGV